MPIGELASDGIADDRCRTFVFEGEGHTLGNALRCVIARYPEVSFCGYTVPHPTEDKMNFRIQTTGPKAITILKKGLRDLEKHCDHISNVFQESLTTYNEENNT